MLWPVALWVRLPGPLPAWSHSLAALPGLLLWVLPAWVAAVGVGLSALAERGGAWVRAGCRTGR